MACGEAVGLGLPQVTLSQGQQGEECLHSDLVGIGILWPLELDLHRPCKNVGVRGCIAFPRTDMLES